MASVYDNWHGDHPPRRLAEGTFTATVVENTTQLNVSFNITNYRARKYSGQLLTTGSGNYGSFNESVTDTFELRVDGTAVCSNSPQAWTQGQRNNPDSRSASASKTTRKFGCWKSYS